MSGHGPLHSVQGHVQSRKQHASHQPFFRLSFVQPVGGHVIGHKGEHWEVGTQVCTPSLWAVGSSGWLGRAWWLLGDGIDDVGFDAINPGSGKPVEDLVLHLAG